MSSAEEYSDDFSEEASPRHRESSAEASGRNQSSVESRSQSSRHSAKRSDAEEDEEHYSESFEDFEEASGGKGPAATPAAQSSQEESYTPVQSSQSRSQGRDGSEETPGRSLSSGRRSSGSSRGRPRGSARRASRRSSPSSSRASRRSSRRSSRSSQRSSRGSPSAPSKAGSGGRAEMPAPAAGSAVAAATPADCPHESSSFPEDDTARGPRALCGQPVLPTFKSIGVQCSEDAVGQGLPDDICGSASEPPWHDEGGSNGGMPAGASEQPHDEGTQGEPQEPPQGHATEITQLPSAPEQWRAPDALDPAVQEISLLEFPVPLGLASQGPPQPLPRPASLPRAHDALPRHLQPHAWDLASLGQGRPRPREAWPLADAGGARGFRVTGSGTHPGSATRSATEGSSRAAAALPAVAEAQLVERLAQRFVLGREAPVHKRRARSAYQEMLQQVAWGALEPSAAQEVAALLSQHWLEPISPAEALRAFRRCIYSILTDERVLDIVEHQMALHFGRRLESSA
uniref:Uncharacterized protein n=1 Tax=Alexandrium monilatum TaxID=311494 RepID=A0A7S4QRQ1_9DINO